MTSDNAGLLQGKATLKAIAGVGMGGCLEQDINELVSAMMRRIKSATGSDGVCIFVVGPKENELDVYSLDCQLGTGTFKAYNLNSFADTIATYVLRSGKHWAGTREQLSATFSNELLLTEKLWRRVYAAAFIPPTGLLGHSV